MMLEKIKQYIKTNRLFSSGDKLIIAVSGGPDSITLLHILKRIAVEWNIKIAAAHLNHKLRDEADEEEAFVRRICSEWEIPYYSRSIDIQEAALAEKKSIEEAARDCRYQFFQELRQEIDADCIATAHHVDDNVETVLQHFLRGSGVKGLRGIMPVNDNLVRPLLCVNKEEINEYLELHSLPYRIDMSNYDTRFLRNRVRHELIPYLQEKFNPRLVENLNNLALIAREEYEAMEIETARLEDSIVLSISDDTVVVDNQRFCKIHPAYQRRIILRILAGLRGSYGWSALDVQLIRDLTQKQGSAKKIKLKQDIWAYKVYNNFIIGSIMEEQKDFSYPAAIPGSVKIDEIGETYSLKIITKEEYKNNSGDGNEIYLDYDKLSKDVVLRSRTAGDKITLSGMRGHKKIKDYFIDRKVPAFERDKIPLLTSKDEVYAVIGYCISADAGINEQSRNYLVIRKEIDDKTN